MSRHEGGVDCDSDGEISRSDFLRKLERRGYRWDGVSSPERAVYYRTLDDGTEQWVQVFERNCDAFDGLRHYLRVRFSALR